MAIFFHWSRNFLLFFAFLWKKVFFFLQRSERMKNVSFTTSVRLSRKEKDCFFAFLDSKRNFLSFFLTFLDSKRNFLSFFLTFLDSKHNFLSFFLTFFICHFIKTFLFTQHQIRFICLYVP